MSATYTSVVSAATPVPRLPIKPPGVVGSGLSSASTVATSRLEDTRRVPVVSWGQNSVLSDKSTCKSDSGSADSSGVSEVPRVPHRVTIISPKRTAIFGKKPPPSILGKKPPPSYTKNDAAASKPIVTQSMLPRKRLHWQILPPAKIHQTIWESIGENSARPVEAPGDGRPQRCKIAKLLSQSMDALDSLSFPPRCESTYYPPIEIDYEELKKLYFRPTDEPSGAGVAPPNARIKNTPVIIRKVRVPPSVLSDARFRSVAVCLKGLQLDSANNVRRIARSAHYYYEVLCANEFGSLTPNSLTDPNPLPVQTPRHSLAFSLRPLKELIRARRSRLLLHDELRLIVECWPTAPEINAILQVAEKGEPLHPIDGVLLELLRYKSLKLKLEALLGRISFEFEIRRLCGLVQKLRLAALKLTQQLEAGQPLVRLLEASLAIGNFINDGSYSANAKGIRVGSLQHLSEYKSAVNNASLVRILALWVRKLDSSRDFIDSVADLGQALKDAIAIDMTAVGTDLAALASLSVHVEKLCIVLDQTVISGSEGSSRRCSASGSPPLEMVTPYGRQPTAPRSAVSRGYSRRDTTSQSRFATSTNRGHKPPTRLCTEWDVLTHIRPFSRWASGTTQVLQREFSLIADRLHRLSRLLGEPDKSTTNKAIRALDLFLQEFQKSVEERFVDGAGQTKSISCKFVPAAASANQSLETIEEIFRSWGAPSFLPTHCCTPIERSGVENVGLPEASGTTMTRATTPILLRCESSPARSRLSKEETRLMDSRSFTPSLLETRLPSPARSSDSLVDAVVRSKPFLSPSGLLMPVLRQQCAACNLLRDWREVQHLGDLSAAADPTAPENRAITSLLLSGVWTRMLGSAPHSVQTAFEAARQFLTGVIADMFNPVPESLLLDWEPTHAARRRHSLMAEFKREVCARARLNRLPQLRICDDDLSDNQQFYTPVSDATGSVIGLAIRHNHCPNLDFNESTVLMASRNRCGSSIAASDSMGSRYGAHNPFLI